MLASAMPHLKHILLIMIIITGLSTVPFAGWGQAQTDYFQQAFDHQSYDELGEFVTETSQGYLTAGSSLKYATGDHFVLTGHVNKQGDSLWQKNFRRPGAYPSSNGGLSLQDGYLLYGNIWDTGSTNQNKYIEGMVAKFNNQAELQWFNRFDAGLGNSGEIEWISQALPAPNGGYILIGTADNGNDQTLFAKFDSQGQLLYKDIHKNDQKAMDNRPSCIEAMNNSKYLYGGGRTTPAGNLRPFITKIDSSGTILWDQSLHVPDSNGTGNISDIIRTYDNNYLLIGHRDHPPDFANNIPGMKYGWVRKVDSAGNVLWQHEYKPSIADAGFLRFGRQLQDSSFVLIGGMHPKKNDPSNEGWMMKISPEGDSIWSRTHRHPKSQTSRYLTWYDFIIAEDGGFVLSGNSDGLYGDPYDNDAVLMKVDSAGCIWPGCEPPPDDTATDTTGILSHAKQNASVTVAPNPFSGATTIQFHMDEKQHGTPRLTLYDLQGRAIRQLSPQEHSSGTVPSATFRLEQNGLARGTYLYRITIKEKSVASGKVIVE